MPNLSDQPSPSNAFSHAPRSAYVRSAGSLLTTFATTLTLIWVGGACDLSPKNIGDESESGGDTQGDTTGDTQGDTTGDTQGDTTGDTQGDTTGDTQGDTTGGDPGECGPMDVAGAGPCEAIIGVAWNGEACVDLSGCECEGADCDVMFEDVKSCEAVYANCQGTSECAGLEANECEVAVGCKVIFGAMLVSDNDIGWCALESSYLGCASSLRCDDAISFACENDTEGVYQTPDSCLPDVGWTACTPPGDQGDYESCQGVDPGFDPDDQGVQMCGEPLLQDNYAVVEPPTIEGDTLVLKVEYGGGCEEHDFGLCWGGEFLESNPVQVNVVIPHNSNNDPCEAALQETLSFDLSDLKTAWQEGYQQENGTILINLDGGGQAIEYVF